MFENDKNLVLFDIGVPNKALHDDLHLEHQLKLWELPNKELFYHMTTIYHLLCFPRLSDGQ